MNWAVLCQMNAELIVIGITVLFRIVCVWHPKGNVLGPLRCLNADIGLIYML